MQGGVQQSALWDRLNVPSCNKSNQSVCQNLANQKPFEPKAAKKRDVATVLKTENVLKKNTHTL